MALDAMTRTRTETDSLGSLEIPADAYWGIHTARALENFPVSKRPISVYKDLVRALAMVKQASARANREIGALDPEKADLIDRASQLVIDGKFHEQFVVGVIQGGAGTSTNMNANEVITNVALELAGREKGDYAFLSPIDDANRSQSTNDVYPTAIKVGLGLDLETATDLVESTSDTGAFMSFSSSLKRNAIKMSKICNDLRLLSSGPQAGFGEINLPARQAGSSIMPGKVNPVIPEVVNQVAFSVIGEIGRAHV